MSQVLKVIEKSFAPIALIVSAVAWFAPEPFLYLRPHIPRLLGLIMFSMGATLTGEDFRRVLLHRRAILIVVGMQYTIMPLTALILARGFDLSPALSVGTVLVGSCPGGTASNVICYLAGADLALSLSMTLCSTLLAPLATPAVVWLIANQWVPIPVAGLFQSIIAIVILPLAGGFLLRRWLPGPVERVRPYLPTVAIASIVAIIACVLAMNRDGMTDMSLSAVAVVVLHKGAGFTLGYAVARLLRLDRRTARTSSVEVGMQNSGLAVSLAATWFGQSAALPGALFSLWQNLAGAGLANWWRGRSISDPKPE
jgi:BASS family bile acid:Na+ symporter